MESHAGVFFVAATALPSRWQVAFGERKSLENSCFQTSTVRALQP